jgi:hypothetical protein
MLRTRTSGLDAETFWRLAAAFVCSPLFSDFPGAMSLKMPLAAKVPEFCRPKIYIFFIQK